MSTPSDNGIPMLTEVIKPDAKPVAATPMPPAAPAAARPQPVMPPSRPAAGAASAPATAPASAAVPPLPPASILKTSPFAPATPSAVAPEVPPKPATPAASAPEAPPRQTLSPGLTTTSGGAEINTAGIASPDEWQRLESEIRQRIARQVLERIDFVLDHRIRSSVATVVDQAVDGLANDIKRGLHETLEDIVTRAVAQEIARISPLKK